MTKPFAKPSFKQLLVIALIIVIGLTISWQLPLNNGPSQKDWDANRQNLPEIAALEERIQLNLFGEQAPATEGMGPDIDQPIDIEAMEAKLAGLTKNVTTLRQPTEQELTEFYQAHQADYRQASKFSFSQILFSRTKHGGQAYQKAEQALLAIAQGQMPSGDSSVLQRSYGLKSADKIDQEFGSNFSAKLLAQVLDNPQSLPCWTDPIASIHGVHLVCIDNAVLGDIPDLDSVRSQVINDWRYTVADQD
ncbi:MAG: peptidyl-prolyl cis-trans isomerase [Porticoccaceae bacterium]|nr:peptidyl-prolyl cis-trans isomerase [Porticoccaceae bacterium]